MDMRYITAAAFAEMARRWPGAVNFLVHESLIEEKRQLTQEVKIPHLDPRRRSWIKQRLEELKDY
jgi:hypothetical protein